MKPGRKCFQKKGKVRGPERETGAAAESGGRGECQKRWKTEPKRSDDGEETFGPLALKGNHWKSALQEVKAWVNVLPTHSADKEKHTNRVQLRYAVAGRER